MTNQPASTENRYDRMKAALLSIGFRVLDTERWYTPMVEQDKIGCRLDLYPDGGIESLSVEGDTAVAFFVQLAAALSEGEK